MRMKSAETRVLIAKDVLKSLRNKHIKTYPGIYLSSEALDDWNNPEIVGQQLCGLLKSKPCEVCAIGALFVSQVERFNKLEYNPNKIHSGCLMEHLYKVFSMTQLHLIEACFEGWEGPKKKNQRNGYDGYSFVQKYPDGTKRMEAIMKNIVKNNGSFIP